MAKLLLLSCVLISVGLPIRAARGVEPRRALRRALLGVAAYNLFWVFAALYIYPRLAH